MAKKMGEGLERSPILLDQVSARAMSDMFPGLALSDEQVAFTPTRAAGLQRLERFAARTARNYASTRNYDFGAERRTNVSALSTWIRHRLITEEEY